MFPTGRGHLTTVFLFLFAFCVGEQGRDIENNSVSCGLIFSQHPFHVVDIPVTICCCKTFCFCNSPGIP
jgi:hypothetical protein